MSKKQRRAKDPTLEKVRGYIAAKRLFAPGDRLLVGVSGGADSVALLDLLASVDLDLHLVVGHMNHCLRGEESDCDENFVRQLSVDYNLPFVSAAVDVESLRRRHRMSLEEAARAARHQFLSAAAAEASAHAIALGHHADDQSETVLMRLLRGSGGTGLAGMKPRSGILVRPLLGLTRKEIILYLNRRGLAYREDSSNSDTRYLRNLIRHELLPQFSSINPNIAGSLNATALILASDEAVLEELTETAFLRHGKMEGSAVLLNISGLLSEREGVRLRLYRMALRRVRGDLFRISYHHLQAVEDMVVRGKPNCSLDLPDGTQVRRVYGGIVFDSSSRPEAGELGETEIPGPGEYTLGDGRMIIVSETDPPTAFVSPPTVAFFDAGSAPFPWLLRSFRNGDRITPLGMAGRKKVKEIFMEAKVPIAMRRQVPLLFSGENLMWVYSLSVSDRTKVREGSHRALRAEIRGVPPRIDL